MCKSAKGERAERGNILDYKKSVHLCASFSYPTVDVSMRRGKKCMQKLELRKKGGESETLRERERGRDFSGIKCETQTCLSISPSV